MRGSVVGIPGGGGLLQFSPREPAALRVWAAEHRAPEQRLELVQRLVRRYFAGMLLFQMSR